MAADVSSLAMTPDLGAEVRGVDLSSPLSDACFARIMEIFERYCVIFFRGQRLELQHLLRFASRFGELDVNLLSEQLMPGLPQVQVLSNVNKDGRASGVRA
jgi:taurine dioxygenase